MSAQKDKRGKAKTSPAVPPLAALNSPLAVLMHRLEVASDKLDMVVQHYPDPGKCYSGDIGAIALTRDVAAELSALYVGLNEYLAEAGLTEHGPWLDRFPEDLPSAESAADGEARS